MIIPKEIVDKMEQVNALTLEISKWMYVNIDTDGSVHRTTGSFSEKFIHQDYYEFTDKPTGIELGDGEYCEQHRNVYKDDGHFGRYYYPTEKGNYFWFYFDI